jgi:hypothetical protein
MKLHKEDSFTATFPASTSLNNQSHNIRLSKAYSFSVGASMKR